MRMNTRNTVAAGATALAILGGAAVPLALADTNTAHPAITRTALASEDAYVDAAHATRHTGRSTKLVASRSTGHAHGRAAARYAARHLETSLVKFDVPAAPAGYDRSRVVLQLSVSRTTAAVLRLREASSAWHESSVSWTHDPRLGATVGSARVHAGQSLVSFDVTRAAHSGVQSFALQALAGSTTVRSSEAGRHVAPRLAVVFTPKHRHPAPKPPAPTGHPTGTPTGHPTGTPSPTHTVPAPTHTTATPSPTSTTTTTTSAPSPTTTSAPSPTTSAPAPVGAGGVRIGMSAPSDQWSNRLAETGGVDSRRVFSQLANPDGAIRTVASEVAAGRMPVVSFKVPGNDWTGVAAGRYDAQLRDISSRLSTAAHGGQVFVTLHHEPDGDGTPADYAAMMRHALPILGAPSNVLAGPIVNGFWWSRGAQGKTDAEIAQWLPADVLARSEVVAADTYQGGQAANPGENAGVKIAGMSAWASRVGVHRLGIGEYNGLDAPSIKAAGDAVLADPRFVFADVFNSNDNNRAGVSWQLTGERLAAFRSTVSRSRAMR